MYNIILDSLSNELSLYQRINYREGYKSFRFRPYTKSICNSIPFIVILLIPFLPFIKQLLRFRFPPDTSNTVAFVISKKSDQLIGDNVESSDFGLISSGDKFKFSISYFITCYKCIFLFIIRFRKHGWFFPSILFIPEMVSVVYFLLNSNVCTVKITNQYDRWAYLIGAVCDLKGIDIELYQHGLLDNNMIPMYKIPNIKKLVCFNENSKIIFLEKIIDNCENIIINKPVLDVRYEKDEFSVLVCGTLGAKNQQKEIDLVKLLAINGTNVYFKPHPLSKDNDYNALINNNVVFIYNNIDLPNVGKLFHTTSTFALEYKNTVNEVELYDLSDVDDVIFFFTHEYRK